MATKMIIGLIILIASFIVILVLFFNLDLGEVTDQEVCHYSVVARASAISAANSLKEITSLNCKTQYVCITNDGTCEKLTSPETEKVKNKEEVYEVLANQLAECWWIFGEGKVDYIGKELLSAGSLYCSLCSQVVFDDSLTSVEGLESGEIDKGEFYQYLDLTSYSEENISYWNYLYGESSPEQVNNALQQTEGNYNLGKINLNKRYYLVMGIVSDIGKWQYALGTGVVAAGVFGALTIISGGAFIPATLILWGTAGSAAAGGTAGYLLGTIKEGESEQQFLRPTIIEASNDFDLLKCKDTNTLS